LLLRFLNGGPNSVRGLDGPASLRPAAEAEKVPVDDLRPHLAGALKLAGPLRSESPMPDTTPKKFRLSFVNAADEVPRLVRAYVRACNGEFSLVLRPPGSAGFSCSCGRRRGRCSGGRRRRRSRPATRRECRLARSPQPTPWRW
jgi:hypothetical protein